jgi:preprotein translocase SecE subunit
MKDKILYTLIALLMVGSFTLYGYMLEIKEVYAYISTLITLFIAAILYINTTKGKKTLKFLKLSGNELKLITWSKKETVLPLSFKIIAIIMVSTLIIWGFDIFIFKFISSTLH